MRKTILRLVAAVALVTAAGAAPAMACGGLFTGAHVSPCGHGESYGPDHGYGYAGSAAYERLPDPGRYYYVNRGPSFSGPGNFAPYPTYQETAISGPRGYDRPNYGFYDGGPYGGATNHYSYAQPSYRAPVVYSYPPRHRAYRHGYSMQSGGRHGYSQQGFAPRYGRHHGRFAGPRVMYAPRYAGPHRGHHQHPMHHAY